MDILYIVMPAYNARSYIGATIAAVQAQTVGDWELIVVDDASSDGCAEAVSDDCADGDSADDDWDDCPWPLAHAANERDRAIAAATLAISASFLVFLTMLDLPEPFGNRRVRATECPRRNKCC